MQLLLLISLLLSIMNRIASAILSEKTSYSFAGSNNYYLHAQLSEERVAYISALQADGAKVVRLWITGIASSCTKSSNTSTLSNYEVTIGEYETATLDAIDSVLFQLHAAGIKAIISPHDANLLPPNGSTTGYNGIDIYGQTYGTSYNFYTNITAQQQYDRRLASILNFVSPRFNKRWAQLHEAILAFDLQNEPMIASEDLLNADDSGNWLCERAHKMQQIIRQSGVKIATGGIGGSQYSGHEYNLLEKALNCPAIDIMSVHGYMNYASQWAYFFPALSNQAATAKKHCMVEEWGVNTTPTNDDVATQVAVFNSAGVPWMYWMAILGKSVDQNCTVADEPCCHRGLSMDEQYDFEISLTSLRANWSNLFHTADMTVSFQDWTCYVY